MTSLGSNDLANGQKGIKTIVWGLIVLSLLIHTVSLILSKTIFYDFRWAHLPFHAFIEGSGTLIALLVAFKLSSLDRHGESISYHVWIAAALVGMGLLDGFHAICYAGKTFVWLHSMASFVGGVLFSLCWLPVSIQMRVKRWWLWVVALFTTVMGVVSIKVPEWLPAMIHEGEFTGTAKALNIVGGVLLFSAAIRIVRTYFKTKNIDDLLFCLHCSLFGAAAIMFEQSVLWDFAWWGWHVLRFLAYFVALIFVIRSEINIYNQNRHLNAHLESEVEKRTLQLQEVNDDLDQFAYIASHDLKAPLRNIFQLCSILQEDLDGKIPSESYDDLKTLEDRAMRMHQLVDSLLKYSRSLNKEYEFEEFDLSELMKKDVFRLLTFPKGMRFETKGDMVSINSYKVPLQQILHNLVSNAIKHHDDPQNAIITIQSRRFEDYFEFSVIDNGPGIQAKYHDYVFELFKTLESQDKVEGSGIGLSIVLKIVKKYGGEIHVDSPLEDGRGAAFRFTWKQIVS